MKCPACNSQLLKIEIAFKGQVACAFSDDDEFDLIDNISLDSEWNDSSSCACLDCHWTGNVREARFHHENAVLESSAPFTTTVSVLNEVDVQVIQKRLLVEHCPALFRAAGGIRGGFSGWY